MAKKKSDELEVKFAESESEGDSNLVPDPLDAAFELIKQKIADGYQFSNSQKDVGIQISIDALAPTERPWFFEIAAMNRLPLWATLWGQFRRCSEWGMAQAPICDPGWENAYGPAPEQYGLGEEICPICENVFQKGNPGQLYCSNPCGAEAEKRKRVEFAEQPTVIESEQKFSEKFAAHFPQPMDDESESVRLPDDVALTEE